MTDLSKLVSQVEHLGGGFRLEAPLSDNPKLHYWLPRRGRTRSRTHRERILRRVRLHQHAIAEFVCLRDLLIAWQPGRGTWVQ